MRKGVAVDAAALMDRALASFTEKRHRVQVLPPAIVAYTATGKASQARQCLDEYLGLLRAQGGTSASTRRIAGLQALVAGAENRPYAVIDALTPAVGSDASNPQLWRMLAEAYSRTDQAGRAVNALNQYRRLNPQDPQATLELARQYSKLSEWRSAYDAAVTAESQDSSSIAAKVLRVGAAINLAVLQRGGIDTAGLKTLSTELADLRQAQPDQLDIRLLQAIVANYLEPPENVERLLKQAMEECPEPLRAEMQLGGHYLRAKRTKEAIAVCEAACQRHPNLAEPWLSLADVHLANTEYGSALDCLRRGLLALTEKGERRSLSIRLAFLEVVHGDRTAGINLLKEMAAQDPQEIQARLLLLGIRGIREDPVATEQLIGELKRAEGESGLWWRAHQESLWMSAEDWRKRQKEIEGLLRLCVDANPAWSAPVLLQADLYERLGDNKRVEDALRQALSVSPSAADVAGRLLALLEKQGRFSDAEKVLQQIQVSPRVLSAWQVRIALGLGDFSRATDELKLRAANDAKDASSRIQLARLVYQQTKDVNQAFKYLQEAEAIASDTQTLIVVKASILKAEGKAAEALQVLDDYVTRHEEFSAHWMRAVYLVEQGEVDRAEKDYRKLTTFAQNSEAGYELLGNFYGGTKRLDQGIAAIEEGLGAHPASLGLRRSLMRLLFRRAQAKDRERATEILAELEKQLPQDAELLATRAALMLEQPTPESLAGARVRLENAVKLEPTAVNAHYTLIGIAMRQAEYKVACDYAVRALESNPRNLVLLLARGRAELALGFAPMAVRLAREALQQDPNSRDAVSLLADGALRSRDRTLLQEARTTIDSSLRRDPKNEALLVSRAHVLTSLEQPKAAIPELEAYYQTKEGGQSVVALVTLADLYRLSGDADKSRQKIEQAQQMAPNSQAVVHARLLWLVSQNRWEELKGISSAYLSAQEQDPTMVLGAASILAASDSAELKKEGLKLFEHAAALSPTSAEVRLGLASTLYQTGDAERAEKTYREWLAQHPDDVRALNDLAWILQERFQRYDAALELANKGLKLAPDNVNLLDTRGTILMNLPNRLVEAKNDFARLVTSLPEKSRERAKALLRLGRICAQLNDPAQAKQYLQAALDLDRELNVFTEAERSEILKIMQPGGK
jgi:tetratricopeptide (TPR) repeat protein